MKRLMIIAAVVCAAFASQAAQYDWSTKSTGKVYSSGTTTVYDGMAYIFADVGTTTQALIFEALVAGKDINTLGSLDSSIVDAGKISAKNDKFNYSGDITSYVAIVGDGEFYIGPSITTTAAEVGAAGISFNLKATSQAAAMDASNGWNGAGWYQTVPEPTSGLLLLLGMAGLALKRKQA